MGEYSGRILLHATGVGVLSPMVSDWLFGTPSRQSEADRPNFVIMIADDQGWNDVGGRRKLSRSSASPSR